MGMSGRASAHYFKEINMVKDPPKVACFTEGPHREPGEIPLFSITAGRRWDSVFIEVSTATYISERFNDWLRNCVLTRVLPGGSVRIAILDGRNN